MQKKNVLRSDDFHYVNDSENESDFQVVENPDIIPNDLDSDLQDWINSVSTSEDESYTTTLYKFDHPRVGQRKEYCQQWSDEAPTLHDIGCQFGGGRYNMIVSFPKNHTGKRPIRSYKFRIHSNYDKMINGSVSIAQQQNNSIESQLRVMKELIAMMMPVIRQQPVQVPETVDPLRQMSIVQDVIKESAKNQIGMYRDFMTNIKNIEMPEEAEDEEESTAETFIKMLEPLLSQWLPVILGSGPRSQIAVETVKALPQFKRAVSNKKELVQLIEYVYNKEGKEKTLQLLKKLKISVGALPAKYKNMLK